MRAIHPHGVGTPPDASTPTAGPAPPPWACRTASAAIYHARHGTVAVSEPLQPASRLNGVAPVRTTRIRQTRRVACVPSVCHGCERGTTPGHLSSMEGKRRGRGRRR